MDELQELRGVGDSTAGKLHQAGYDTYEQITSATVEELVKKAGIPASSAERIIQSSQEMIREFQTRESEIQSAREILQELQAVEPPEVEQPSEPEEEPTEEIPEVPEPEVPEEAPPEAEQEPEEPAEETAEVSEEPPPETPAVDLYGITDGIVEAILQDPKVMEKFAKDIGSEFADIMKKEMRGKLVEKAISQPNFRKMLISRIVKKLP